MVAHEWDQAPSPLGPTMLASPSGTPESRFGGRFVDGISGEGGGHTPRAGGTPPERSASPGMFLDGIQGGGRGAPTRLRGVAAAELLQAALQGGEGLVDPQAVEVQLHRSGVPRAGDTTWE